MSKIRKCPGSEVQIEEAPCPHCGEMVEFFTGDKKVKCSNCKNLVFRDINWCQDYCPYAKECLGQLDKGRKGDKGL
ncbi:MAG: phosphohydrolase [Actinobacteria bacterium]|nr:MAG: phosphohydrolase [Actinomycetota bacterium]